VSTVLVVDDEWAIAEVLGEILSDEGYRVITASNGKQALSRINDEMPDLIILDFMMPVMDGAATLRALAEDPALAAIPVLLMSSLPAVMIRERCSGFSGYIQKPFLVDEIARKVTEILADGAMRTK
jgi:CheY-like chemotaxis protein